MAERFDSLTDEEINKAIDEAIPASSKKQTRWGSEFSMVSIALSCVGSLLSGRTLLSTSK